MAFLCPWKWKVTLNHANDILSFVFTGKYIYTEASSPRSFGDNAKLQLVLPSGSSSSCLVFFYHMYGSSMGTLNIFSGNTLIFTASGNHGDNWRKVTRAVNSNYVVSIPKSFGPEFLQSAERWLDMCMCEFMWTYTFAYVHRCVLVLLVRTICSNWFTQFDIRVMWWAVFHSYI